MSKIITITSGKGGVGKTTTAINLGTALNSFGKEVIILDANLTTPNIGIHLGAPIVPISLNHVLHDKAKIAEAVYENESGTKIVPSSLSAREIGDINSRKLKDIGKKLKKMADYVIYDSAAGLGDEAISAIEAADELIIVTNPEITAVTDALKTAKVAELYNKPIRGVIVTKHKKSSSAMPVTNIQEMLELPILGLVSEDKLIPKALVMKDALIHTHPKSKVARQYKAIAAKIMGNNNYKEKLSIFERLFG